MRVPVCTICAPLLALRIQTTHRDIESAESPLWWCVLFGQPHNSWNVNGYSHSQSLAAPLKPEVKIPDARTRIPTDRTNVMSFFCWFRLAVWWWLASIKCTVLRVMRSRLCRECIAIACPWPQTQMLLTSHASFHTPVCAPLSPRVVQFGSLRE